MNIDLEKFSNACIAMGKGQDTGNIKDDRKHYRIVQSVYFLLKKDNRLDELLELLDHENPHVRFRAAEFALRFEPIKAEQALEKISKTERGVGFVAMMTLSEWRKGNLKFEDE